MDIEVFLKCLVFILLLGKLGKINAVKWDGKGSEG